MARLRATAVFAVCSLPVIVSSGNPYGNVSFATSCDPAVEGAFNTAMSQLYSFEYDDAHAAFESILAQTDSQCCMAFVGAAWSFTHPIWDFITDDRLESTREMSLKASECVAASSDALTPREQAYVDALDVYASTDPSVDLPEDRLHAYATAMKGMVYEPYFEVDENAGITYGLALLASGYYSEDEPSLGFPHLSEAGAVEKQVHSRNAASPGALHYMIHAYDQPATASKAYQAANEFRVNSLSVPHAIHMPSHIYSDLGMWNLSVSSNVDSLNVAYTQGGLTGDWFHGAYFLQVAYLQLAMDCDASALGAHFQDIALGEPDAFFGHLEAAVRVPAHKMVETRDWESAASFSLEAYYNGSDSSVWDAAPWSRIYESFLRTAGLAQLGSPVEAVVAACDAVERANETLLGDPSWSKHQLPYYRLSFDVMVQSARAWKAFRAVSYDAGIEAMREVASSQMSSWAPEVSHCWDANEQLAQMWLLANSTTSNVMSALDAFETAHRIYPNRFHSLAGAGQCAEVLGDDAKTESYYGQLIALTSAPFPDTAVLGVATSTCGDYAPDRRPELIQAHAYFGRAVPFHE